MTTTSEPTIVLGTMNYGTTTPKEAAFALLDRFAERGGVWLDTADCYAFWSDPAGVGGASERVLGEWLAGAGGGVCVATKVRWNPTTPHDWPASAEGLSATAIVDGLRGSLDRMGLDAVDLLWAHADDRDVPLEETVAAFGALVAEGRVARLGAANHAAWRVERARTIAAGLGVAGYSALQLRHSLVQPRPGAALPDQGHRLLHPDDLDLAADAGMEIWAYTPLINGGYVRADRPFPEAYAHRGTERALRALDRVADARGATRNQVVLAWLLRQGISPIVGASSTAQLDEALDARELVLDDADMAALAAAR